MKTVKYKIEYKEGGFKTGQFSIEDPNIAQALRLIENMTEKPLKAVFVSILEDEDASNKKPRDSPDSIDQPDISR